MIAASVAAAENSHAAADDEEEVTDVAEVDSGVVTIVLWKESAKGVRKNSGGCRT